MRTAGFPCRLLGCDEVFQVQDQNSMDALHAASAVRTAHEESAHDYHHVKLSTDAFRTPYMGRKAAKPSGDAGGAGRS